MRSTTIATVLAALTLSVASAASAQSTSPPVPRDTTLTHVLYLVDGSMLVGKLVARDSSTITFETNGGTLTVPVTRVKELRVVRPTDVRGNEYWFPDANETRLFFAPTGRMLKQGEGYYSNTYLLLQNFVGAPSDKVTLGGGLSIIPSDDFIENNVYYFTPKVGIYNQPRNNVAVGALIGAVPAGNGTSFGILYAVGTHGGPEASVTGGIGYGYQDGDLSSRPVFMFGGASRVSRRVSLVSENYGLWTRHTDVICTTSGCQDRKRDEFDGLISYGLRFMGEKISTDFALFNVTGNFIFPGIPYIAFAVKF